MTTTATTPDLSAVKARQQRTWASGDFSVVAGRIVLVSERLAEAADLRAGWRVLDVACGNGNAAIAAARSGTSVVGVDYVPELLANGRVRVAAEGLDVELREGDAENLPVDDGSFDAVLSVFGSMFAPNQQRAADELVRAARPGGTIALASWTPDGFIGDLFRATAAHVSPPPGLASPMEWGREERLRELFGDAIASIRSVEQVNTFRYRSAEEFVEFFRRWYGPTLTAFGALDEDGRQALAAELADLARRYDRHGDGGPVAVPATYLETVIRLA